MAIRKSKRYLLWHFLNKIFQLKKISDKRKHYVQDEFEEILNEECTNTLLQNILHAEYLVAVEVNVALKILFGSYD